MKQSDAVALEQLERVQRNSTENKMESNKETSRIFSVSQFKTFASKPLKRGVSQNPF